MLVRALRSWVACRDWQASSGDPCAYVHASTYFLLRTERVTVYQVSLVVLIRVTTFSRRVGGASWQHDRLMIRLKCASAWAASEQVSQFSTWALSRTKSPEDISWSRSSCRCWRSSAHVHSDRFDISAPSCRATSSMLLIVPLSWRIRARPRTPRGAPGVATCPGGGGT